MSTRLALERDGEVVTEGELRHVFVTAGEDAKVPIPEQVRAGILPYTIAAD